MDPRLVPKGSSPEDQYGGKRKNQAGVYYHPEANKFIETSSQKRSDGTVTYNDNEGRVQGDAFTQIGYRPATDEELKEYRARQADNEEKSRIAQSRKTTHLAS